MWKQRGVCRFCGEIFLKEVTHQKYCNKKCRIGKSNQRTAEERKIIKKSPRAKPQKTLAQTIKEADALGMTYGEYVSKIGGFNGRK